MGFYGNITNTTQTNFVFDKIYTNRYSMEQRLLDNKDDGVFIGRYVLIEYGEIDKNNSFIRAYLINNNFYLSDVEDDKTRIKYTEDLSNVKNNYITKGMIIYTLVGNTYTYYECSGPLTTGSIFPAFQRIDLMDLQKDPWFYNMQQDRHFPGNSRGYDSTVWVKTTVNGEIKYVNIAELNSVIPTFQMVADAPTLSPILPHFDTSSTNVYYKLHWQPAWGMRIAEAELQDDGETVYSDYDTEWTQEVYNQDGTVTKKWYNPTTKEWQLTSGTDTKIKADIYFNHAAFDAQVGTEKDSIKKKNTIMQDYIGVTADGESGNEYNKHNNTLDTEKKPDTQQIHINLPAIGNMMSEAWDIIHGTDRDNYRGNAVYDEETGELIKTGSLEGRMKSFEEIRADQIPVKRASDGTLIGSKINNATQYSLPPNTDILDEKALDDIPDKFDGDDPWIETEINTSELVGGTKLNEDGQIDEEYDQTNNSGISIRHTFHAVKNSQTAHDKNSGNFSDESETSKEKLQKSKLPVTNEDTEADDTIKLYTPYIDAKGHVVGKNIETITLPYGFKTITVTNSTNTDKWSQLSGATSSKNENVKNIVADSTKDTFSFKGGNKWIRFKTDATSGADTNNTTTPDGSNTLTIAHETHDINISPLSNDYNDDIKYVKIELNRSTYQKGKYYYKNGDTYEIDNNGTLVSGREYFIINDKLTFQDLKFDTAGHITDNQSHTYTLPYGYKYFETDGLSNKTDDLYTKNADKAAGTDETKDTEEIANKTEAHNTQDVLTINPANKWIQTKFTDNDGRQDELVIAHEIHSINEVGNGNTNLNTINNPTTNEATNGNLTIYDWSYDEAGHITSKRKHTYTLPYGYKTFTTNGLASLDKNSKEIVSDLYTTINNVANGKNTSSTSAEDSQTIASNTQDSMAIEPYNKWIQTQLSDDKLVIAHEIHAINTEKDTTNLNDLKENKIQNEINIPDWNYDEAGHIKKKGEHIYTLPYGYKKVSANNNTAVTAAPDTTTTKPTANNTQDTLNLTTSNNWIKLNTLDNAEHPNEVQIGHILSPISSGLTATQLASNKIEHKSTDTTIGTFGGTFKILNFKTDNAGHIIEVGENTITIPQGSAENINNTDTNSNVIQTANLLSSISLDAASGKITGRYNTTNSIILSGYNANKTNNHSNDVDDVEDNDTINTAFAKLQNQIIAEEKARQDAITALKVTDTANNTKYVSGVSETNGKITVSRAGTDMLQLSNYTIATSPSDVANGDTINDAFGKIQKQIKEIYGSEEIATNFDTIKEIAAWLDANDSNADKIIDSIATLNGDETVSGSVKKSIKDAIIELNSSVAVSNNSKNYLTGITIVDGKITEKTEGTLGSAAFTESTNYATAAQGALADTAIQLNTEFVYDKIQKDDGEGNIIEEELKTTIETMAKEIASLKQVLKDNGLIIE